MPGRVHWGGLARISNRYWKALISLQRHSRKQVAWTDRFLECRCSESRVSYFELPDRDPHYAAHDAFRCHVTVMSGLPEAGKGTWIANNRPDHPVVSFDLIREELGVAATDNRGQLIQAAHERAGEHLRADSDFIWNATNVTRQNRSKILRLLRDYGAHIEIAYVEVGHEQLYRQNRGRPDAVPDTVIDHLVKKLEPPEAWEAHRIIGDVL